MYLYARAVIDGLQAGANWWSLIHELNASLKSVLNVLNTLFRIPATRRSDSAFCITCRRWTRTGRRRAQKPDPELRRDQTSHCAVAFFDSLLLSSLLNLFAPVEGTPFQTFQGVWVISPNWLFRRNLLTIGISGTIYFPFFKTRNLWIQFFDEMTYSGKWPVRGNDLFGELLDSVKWSRFVAFNVNWNFIV